MVEENREFKDEDDNEYKFLKQKIDREDYMKKLQIWLDEARLLHYNICSYNLADVRESFGQRFPNPLINLQNENFQNVLHQRFSFLASQNFQNPFLQTVGQPSQRTIPSTYEFVVPPLWKRAAAELMDFLLLLLFKVAMTFILLESFDIVDMGFYGIEFFQKNLDSSDGTLPMAVELLTLELLHRMIVCVYEAYCLKGKFCATPGKRYMGLMVVTAENITPVPNRQFETVSVTRPKPLGWQRSLIRATLKNLFVGLFLPLCIAFYIFPHNRTSYDIVSKSLVVEYHHEFMIYHSTL
ncbi:protein FAM8A1 [Diorhabda sublineata]|uniref:protein FAM8A1 n=1 Tax=Diorhabda sublineata TaxID=1163346 RepID=UPI0024E14F45|nr:protein FAM8A1 [Diorhabda sublineata]